MPQVADLVSLQEHDDLLARLGAELEDARAELADDAALRAAEEAAGAAGERCAELEREQRRLEGEIDGLGERIAREEERLYGGGTGLPKELAGIQREVASLKARRSRIEDDGIAALDAIEEAQAALAEAQATLERERVATEEKRTRLGAAADALEGDIERTTDEREGCRARIEGALLAQYDDLRRRKGGVAVARMRGDVCGACRVNVPPAARKRALDPESPARCPNCERMLTGA